MRGSDGEITLDGSASIPVSIPGRRLARTGLRALVAGVVYFIAAYGSLTLQTGTEGVAIYWPASGIAAGLVIALGRAAYAPIAAGTLAATIAVNLLFGRSFPMSFAFGLLNAAEALAVGWLLDRISAREHGFGRVARIIAFFAAAALSSAVAALGAALVIMIAAEGTTPWPKVWQTWALSDYVGIAVLAPAVVAAIDLVRARARNHEWAGDIVLLLVFGAIAFHALGLRHDDGGWQGVTPGATLLPILIWLSARAQPVVPALAILLLAMLMAVFASAGVGRYGDPRLPEEARVMAVQASLSVAALTALFISALFAERRNALARLKASEARLGLIADAAPGVIFSLERSSRGGLSFTFVSPIAARILGIEPHRLMASVDPFLDRLGSNDRSAVLSALAQSGAEGGALRLEVPFLHSDRRETWLEINAQPVAEANGRVTWHGFIHDVTARRRLVDELNHRTRNLLTVVQAVAEHTARSASAEEFAAMLSERLSGLAASQQLLAAHGWQGVELGELARSQLAHLAGLIDGHQLLIEGPSLTLRPPAAQILGMAIHELSTNACKHGALTRREGRVRLAWTAPDDDAADCFRITWEESGGPPYAPTSGHGFGRKVIVDMAAYQLDGDVEIEAREDGLAWRLVAPACRVILASHELRP